ncbi:MAG: S8 family serine peptidase [Nitrososphaerales archaeon]
MSPQMGKTDAYLMQSFRNLATSKDLFANPTITMLIRLRDPGRFVAPEGFEKLSQIGNIISGRGTVEALEALQTDPNVLGIEASRPANTRETAAPAAPAALGRAGASSTVIPYPLNFVRASAILQAVPAETGDHALVAILDAGIDVLHQAFRDDAGACRIVEVWDQTDPTGPGPSSWYPGLSASYGTVHTAAQIATYIAANGVPASLGRGNPHGTHVASIAAGRPLGTVAAGASTGFSGGVAPGARIVVVVTKTDVGPDDPFSLGYSTSHCDALAYVRAVADRLNLPLAVNVSQGMNAGAHDGTSLLEAAFDEFTGGGRDPGVVVVKAAGNERTFAGHAQITMGSNMLETLTWQSKDLPRTQDVFELWFEACDEFRFTVIDPKGERVGPVTWAATDLAASLQTGNQVALTYTRYHHDNGDSRLLLTLDIGTGSQITGGEWSLEIESGVVRSDGVIDAWVERNNSRPVVFTSHPQEQSTLTIPGTARTVIAVGAVTAALPLWTPNFTSFGPTRDRRQKPEVVAPGVNIVGADARTGTGCRVDSGTSMAAPHVTGAIALLFSRLSKQGSRLPNAAQIRAALTQQTQNFTGRFTPGGGYGVIDVQALLDAFS